MDAQSDHPIPVGRLHRTWCDVEMLVFDYDRVPVETVVLPAGSLFQPWEPDDWRGEKVPITLGGLHSEFDWGVSSAEGHFLRWDDFFSRCETEEAYSKRQGSGMEHRTDPEPHVERPPATFAELAAMQARLLTRARQCTVHGAKLDELLKITDELRRVHAWAAEMQLGAEGYDNTASARRYCEAQEHLLAAAHDIHEAFESLVE